jgi:two-component system sensor histidine kinase PilS (NtrC family)
MARRVRTLLAGRLAAVSFFMGMVVYYQATSELNRPLYGVYPLAAAYAASILYAVLLPFITRLDRFVFIQLCVDIALVTSVIYFTGGLNSPLSFLYVLVIIPAAILLSRKGIYFMATASGVVYSLMLGLEHYGVVKPYLAFTATYEPSDFDYVQMKGLLNIAIYFSVAILAGYLADLLRVSDKRLEQKSQDFTMLQAFNENVLNTMTSGFLAIDMDATILSHNPAAERILGLSTDRLDRQRVDRVLGIATLSDFIRKAESGQTQADQISWRYTRPDGGMTDLNMTVNLFTITDEPQGVIAVVQDVSAIKRMERQIASASRLAAIGRVAAGVAHEIRNPLASLSGSIQMIGGDLEGKLDESGARLMNIIHREVERLNRIVTQFLDYASPAHPKAVETDISRMVTDMVLLLKSSPKELGETTIVEDIEPGLTASVDAEQIGQVLWNLARNGLDAMDRNGALTVTARRNDDDTIKIIVADTGPGVPQENREKIFDPFFTTKQGGTGLGLSTSYKIVESHHGRLSVENVETGGARFILRLPRRP